MLSKQKIIDIAKEYYREKGESKLSKVIVYPESSENRIGVSAIRINKEDDYISIFSLPSKENFEILRKSIEIKL